MTCPRCRHDTVAVTCQVFASIPVVNGTPDTKKASAAAPDAAGLVVDTICRKCNFGIQPNGWAHVGGHPTECTAEEYERMEAIACEGAKAIGTLTFAPRSQP